MWATGFDFGTGALLRMGIRGRDGLALEEHWADGPKTYLGIQTSGFPNLFFPGGPHAAAGNNPRYNGDQVDFVTDMLRYARDHDCDTIEVDPAAEDDWTAMIDRGARRKPSFGASSYYFGANIPGKPRKYLLNSAGRPKLLQMMADVDRRRLQGRSDCRDRRHRRADDPRQPQRRCRQQEAAAPVLAQPPGELVQIPHLPQRDAELEQAQVVDRQERMPARITVLAEQSFDGVIVGDQRRDLRVGNPLEQSLVARVEVAARREELAADRDCGPTRGCGWRSRCAAAACRRARRRRCRPP